MNSADAPIFTDHRLARLTSWLMLVAMWIVGICAAQLAAGGRPPKRALDVLAREVRALVFCHAVRRFQPPPRVTHRFGVKGRLTQRALNGAALRRATRGRDFGARVFAILAVVRDSERHIAALARRLRRGMTRLRVIVAAPEAAAPLALPRARAAAPCADTS